MPEYRTLMINVIGKPIPYAYQVSEPAYQRFKFIEGGSAKSWDYLKNTVFPEIKSFEKEQRSRLLKQINDWQIKTQEELAAHEAHQTAKTNAKDIFDS
jgi:hypothetical protein